MYQRSTNASRRHVRMLNTNWLHISQWFKPVEEVDALTGVRSVTMEPQFVRPVSLFRSEPCGRTYRKAVAA